MKSSPFSSSMLCYSRKITSYFSVPIIFFTKAKFSQKSILGRKLRTYFLFEHVVLIFQVLYFLFLFFLVLLLLHLLRKQTYFFLFWFFRTNLSFLYSFFCIFFSIWSWAIFYLVLSIEDSKSLSFVFSAIRSKPIITCKFTSSNNVGLEKMSINNYSFNVFSIKRNIYFCRF